MKKLLCIMIAASLTGCVTTGDGSSGGVNPLNNIMAKFGQKQSPSQKIYYDRDVASLMNLVKNLPLSAPDGRGVGFAQVSTVTTPQADYPLLPAGIKDGINIPLPGSEIASNSDTIRLLARQVGTYVAGMPTRPVIVLGVPEHTWAVMGREIEIYSRNTAQVKTVVADANKSFMTIYLVP